MTDSSNNQNVDAAAPVRKEADVYDRQIRLWGQDAQAKMAKSKVLYIHVTGISSEVLKNLVLAGIRASICDGRPYPDAMQSTPCFFLNKDDRKGDDQDTTGNNGNKKTKRTVAEVVKSKIEELNPLLGDCEISNTPVSELSDDYVKQFSIVLASRIGMSDAIRLSKATVEGGGKFYMADCFGLSGACAFDLGANHQYRPEMGKKLLDMTGLKQHVSLETMLQNVPLQEAVNRFHKKAPPVQWIQYRCILEYVEQKQTWPSASNAADFVATITQWIKETSPNLVDHESLQPTALEGLARTATAEIIPVCSVLGGLLGNEAIKVISGKGEPANNTLLFDGVSCKAWTFLVQSSKK